MALILVVDDVMSDRLIAGGLLDKEEDFSVDYASSAMEALEKIEKQVPDLVLTDLQMPDMNGLQLVCRIRESFPLVPVILMTAKGSEDIAVHALQQGAASYVPKKHLAADLVMTVYRTLAASSRECCYARLMNRVAETTFILENDLGLISTLVAHLSQVIQRRHICHDQDAIRVATALDEVLLNAYYHGNLEVDSMLKAEDDKHFHELAAQRLTMSPYVNRRITVTARFSPTDATFVIRDEGPGFHPNSLPDPTDPEYLTRPSGRGLLLIRAFMDEVRFNEVGNEVTLIKHRSRPRDATDGE
jgi:CheY-like chemotaxis protein